MSAFDQIGSAEAAAVLAEARAIGISGSFSHRGAVAVTLKALVMDTDLLIVEQPGINTEVRVLTLMIPTGQTGFSTPTVEAEPITPGDTWTFKGRVHYALSPIKKNIQSTVYTVKFAEQKRLDIR